MKSNLLTLSTIFLIIAFIVPTNAQEQNPLVGKWDLTLEMNGEKSPSWLEVKQSGIRTLVGRLVFSNGSARPISEIKMDDGNFSFSLPPQWENETSHLEFQGNIANEKLKGTFVYVDGKSYNWTGVPAPKLPYIKNPKWGEPITLFNGKDLSGWKALGDNQWIVADGVLINPKSGANLVSEQEFMDFKLHLEFRYPENSNSGVFLRGRYEVQIADNYGSEPSDILFAGIYGFLSPSEMVAKEAGKWQSFDITLIGHRVTIIANGIEVITNQAIPGITGGALDSNEGMPGPILLQGDHGPVEFRNVIITPRVD